MAIKRIVLAGLIVFSISIIGCSVSSDIIRSIPKVNSVAIETWPLRTDNFDIFIKPDNDLVINRTSKVLLTIDQESFSTNTENKNQSFYVAVRSKVGGNSFWNSAFVNLLYEGKSVQINKIDYVNILILDGTCNKVVSHKVDAIKLMGNDYACLKIEYDTPQINPLKKFELNLGGLSIDSEKVSPITFEFEGQNKTIETRN
ncbi:hypothetical protein K8B83_16355 [Shewanella inventionis]|jgi:hypothetical protein|uniref:Lipoprotein n=1 Tax=Shewanella inventionis TaxID=1738770 RepID=A0ABQ1JXI6_9GAMM|nr:hypothetical protein [Shewanella inventionis]MCL1160140.1 hypothetical protein [Shewanella inventionis]UAL42412.1 hypothetical protein K8B83_16355 [Shewanella inventionis]GGB77529.1 hypothetical protein GCM10011607_42110 [Shewanella inventionis]